MKRPIRPLMLAALAPLIVGAGPYGPHGPVDPPPPASPPPGRPDQVVAPPVSLSFTFTLPSPAAPIMARDAVLEERSPDLVVFLTREPADPRALGRLAAVEVVEAAPLASLGLVMAVARLAAGDTPEAAAGRLEALPGVAWAQVDHRYQLMGAPRLPKALAMAGLDRDGLAVPTSGTAAMIDTMIDAGHEVFAGGAVEQRTFAAPMSPAVHGTAVASLLVGRGGVGGAGQGARLLSLAAFRHAQPDGPALSQTRYLAKALDAAVAARPNVLNLSFGGSGDRLLAALLDRADAAGVCIVAAAGNGGPQGRAPFPASHPAVLGVTAVDERSRIYPHATPGPQVDVAALGVDLTVAAPGGYRRASGSSFAAAVVSGALLRTAACGRDRNPAVMRAAVLAGARDLGAPGPDATFGAGLFRLTP